MPVPNLQAVRDHAQTLFDCAQNQDADKTQQHCLELPGLTIKGAFSSNRYIEFCQNNLVSSTALEKKDSKVITVHLMDANSNPGLPLMPVVSDAFSIKEFVEYLQQHDLDGTCDTNYGIWQYYSDTEGLGVQFIKSDEHLPPWEPTFPLRQFIHWAYHNTSKGLIHAGTLGLEGIGVLLSGAGGSGKSGTTLAGILSGLDSVGDDYVVADINDKCIKTYPLIKNLKQDIGGLERNDLSLADNIFTGPNWQNKYLFDFERLGAGKRASHLNIKAILLPKISHSVKTSFEKTSSKEAMLSLVPSNLYQLTGNWHKTMNFAAKICRALPAYKVHLGTDPVEIAGSIKAFIESAKQ
ncbi:MAG: serine kinase [Methyloligellaceae bacterium]